MEACSGHFAVRSARLIVSITLAATWTSQRLWSVPRPVFHLKAEHNVLSSRTPKSCSPASAVLSAGSTNNGLSNKGSPRHLAGLSSKSQATRRNHVFLRSRPARLERLTRDC